MGHRGCCFFLLQLSFPVFFLRTNAECSVICGLLFRPLASCVREGKFMGIEFQGLNEAIEEARKFARVLSSRGDAMYTKYFDEQRQVEEIWASVFDRRTWQKEQNIASQVTAVLKLAERWNLSLGPSVKASQAAEQFRSFQRLAADCAPMVYTKHGNVKRGNPFQYIEAVAKKPTKQRRLRCPPFGFALAYNPSGSGCLREDRTPPGRSGRSPLYEGRSQGANSPHPGGFMFMHLVLMFSTCLSLCFFLYSPPFRKLGLPLIPANNWWRRQSDGGPCSGRDVRIGRWNRNLDFGRCATRAQTMTTTTTVFLPKMRQRRALRGLPQCLLIFRAIRVPRIRKAGSLALTLKTALTKSIEESSLRLLWLRLIWHLLCLLSIRRPLTSLPCVTPLKSNCGPGFGKVYQAPVSSTALRWKKTGLTM